MPNRHLYSAVSVTGQSHLGSALPNQDACLVRAYRFGVVLAVADGLGSRPFSHLGSVAACEAVCQAVRLWSRNPAAPPGHLTRLIRALWELQVAPHRPSDCGTTCLFAVLLTTGRLICGQLGDGLIAYESQGRFQIVREKDDDFSNFTQSLHGSAGAGDWTLIDTETGTGPLTLLLATDGMSEDLIPQTRQRFLQHLAALLRAQPTLRQRNAVLRQALVDWPAPSSHDDKTLIVLHRGESVDESDRR